MMFPFLSSLCQYVLSSIFTSGFLNLSLQTDVFLPKHNDLLVNIAESCGSLEALLGRIEEMFRDDSVIESAMGPALQAGFKLMVSVFNCITCLTD